MRNDQTGEYELVVGNPQLLSGFVILVLLCTAAFFLGYEVGQNTPHSAKPQADATAPVSPPSAPVSTPATPVTQPPESQTGAGSAAPQTDAGSAQPPAEAPPQPTTQPARDMPAPPPPKPVAAVASVQPPAAAVAAMPPGSYCQAMAVRQAADAQSLLQTLKDGGMPAGLQTGSDGWVRVMVGPYQDRASLSRAKTELETRFQIRGPVCR
jgi:cell division septation protein DedD